MTDPRDRHQPRRVFVLACASAELLLQAADPRIDVRDLGEQKSAQLAHRLRKRRAGILNRRRKTADMCPPLRGYDAKLRQMPPQRVDRLRALAHQKIA